MATVWLRKATEGWKIELTLTAAEGRRLAEQGELSVDDDLTHISPGTEVVDVTIKVR